MLEFYEGYVSLKKDKFGRFYLRSSKDKPKPSNSTLGFVHVLGTVPDPEKKWRLNILVWDDKNYDYCDGYFFSEPPLSILRVKEGVFGFQLGERLDLFRSVSLFNGKGDLLESEDIDLIKKSFANVQSKNKDKKWQ